MVGYGSVPPQQLTDPDMNTVYLSIFTMLFCCWPCGLVGLIYGIQASQTCQQQQLKNNNWWDMIFHGFLFFLLLLLLFLLVIVQGMQQHYRGQYASAERITKSAKKWTICGIVSGVTYVCVLMFTIVVGYALGFGLGFGLSKDPATDLPTTNAPF